MIDDEIETNSSYLDARNTIQIKNRPREPRHPIAYSEKHTTNLKQAYKYLETLAQAVISR